MEAVRSVQSFQRGLAVIRSFSAHASMQTLSDVAKITGLSRATVRRLVHTLIEEGYVQQHGSSFELTPKVLDLGYAYLSSHQLPHLARPHLQSLSDKVRESSSVAVLDGPHVVYIARVQANRVMTVSIGIGSRFPAYRTSLGRVLLAWLPEARIAAVWEATDRSDPTDTTVRTLQDLLTRLSVVRKTGYALVDQELEVGVRSVAAPIHDAAGDPVAAVNVSTHTSRTSMADIRSQVVPALLQTAEAITTSLTANRV